MLFYLYCTSLYKIVLLLSLHILHLYYFGFWQWFDRDDSLIKTVTRCDHEIKPYYCQADAAGHKQLYTWVQCKWLWIRVSTKCNNCTTFLLYFLLAMRWHSVLTCKTINLIFIYASIICTTYPARVWRSWSQSQLTLGEFITFTFTSKANLV